MSTHTSDLLPRQRRPRVWAELATGGIFGLALGGGAWYVGIDPSASFLLGVIASSWIVAGPLLRRMMRESAHETQDRFEGLDPGRTATDLAILAGALAALVGVGWMFLGRPADDTAKVLQGLLAMTAVGSGWFLIHLMYAMRYARHWYNAEPNCIDFHTDTPPAYSDFLYTAFAVGMSYAISDTDLCTTQIRRIALRHAWLSYLFGTVVVAATINLVAGLAN